MPRNTDAKGRDHGVRENGAHASGGEAATDSEKNDGKQSRTKSVLSRYGGSSSARGLITESWEPLSAKNTSTNIRPSWAPSEENSTITQGSILRATAERDPIADAYTHADATSANSGTVIAPSPLSQAAQQDENCGTVVPFSPLTQAAQEEAFVDPTFFSAQKRTSTEATIVRENSLTDLSRRQTITRDHVESNPPERRRREDSTWTPDASAAKRNTYHKSCEQLGSSLNGMPETVVRSASDISVKVSATGVGVRKMSIVIPEKPILDSQSKPRSASPAHGQFRHMRNPSEAPTTPITPVTPTSATSPNTRDASAPNVLAPFKGDVSFHDRLQWLKDRLDSSMNASSSVSSQRSAANSRTTSSGYTGFPGESRVAQADAFAGYNPALGGATPPRMYRTTSSRTGHNSPGTARKTPMLTVTVPAEGPPSAARTPLDVRGANLTNALGAELPGLTFSPFVVHPTIEVPWTNNYNNAQGSASAVHAQYAFPKPPAPTPVENTPSGSQTYSLDRDYFGYRRSGVHTPKVPSSPYQPTLAQRRKQTPTGVPSTSGTVAVFVHAEDDTCNIFTLPPNTTMNEVKLEALSKMGFVETFESFNMYCMEMAANGETIETRIDPNTPLEHLVPLLPASKLTHPDGTKSEPPSRDSSLSRMNALPPSVKVRLRRKSLPRFTLPVQIDTSIPARARYVLVDQMMKVEDVIQVIALVEGVEMDDEEDTGSICANWGLWREDSSSNLRYLQPSEMPFDPFERKFKYYFRRHQPRRAAKLSNWLGISADMEQVQRLVNQEASAAQDVKRRNDARKSQKLSHILGIDDTTANVSVGNSAGSNGLAKVSEREKEKNKEKDSDSGTFSGTLKRSRQFLSLRKKYPSEADLPDRTATESQPLERTENSVKAQPLSRSLQSVSKSTGDITVRRASALSSSSSLGSTLTSVRNVEAPEVRGPVDGNETVRAETTISPSNQPTSDRSTLSSGTHTSDGSQLHTTPPATYQSSSILHSGSLERSGTLSSASAPAGSMLVEVDPASAPGYTFIAIEPPRLVVQSDKTLDKKPVSRRKTITSVLFSEFGLPSFSNATTEKSPNIQRRSSGSRSKRDSFTKDPQAVQNPAAAKKEKKNYLTKIKKEAPPLGEHGEQGVKEESEEPTKRTDKLADFFGVAEKKQFDEIQDIMKKRPPASRRENGSVKESQFLVRIYFANLTYTSAQLHVNATANDAKKTMLKKLMIKESSEEYGLFFCTPSSDAAKERELSDQEQMYDIMLSWKDNEYFLFKRRATKNLLRHRSKKSVDYAGSLDSMVSLFDDTDASKRATKLAGFFGVIPDDSWIKAAAGTRVATLPPTTHNVQVAELYKVFKELSHGGKAGSKAANQRPAAQTYKEGWLRRYHPQTKKWGQCWGYLSDGQLKLRPTNKDAAVNPSASAIDPEAVISLAHVIVDNLDFAVHKRHAFIILNKDEERHVLAAASQSDSTDWVECIRRVSGKVTTAEVAADVKLAEVPAPMIDVGVEAKEEGIAVDPAEAKMTISDFEIHKVIGRGKFAKVLLCSRKSTQKVYAIKVISKKQSGMAPTSNDPERSLSSSGDDVSDPRLEAQILRTVTHPFIVGLYFAFQSPERLYLVMEYVNGGELYFHVANFGRFAEERVRFYAAELALALECLHNKGIIYRDLKLENILLTREGHVKITDFGLSKLQDDHTQYEPSEMISVVGTLEYLAPEVLQGYPSTAAADWWAYGVVFFEMLCGFHPFYSDARHEIRDKIIHADIEYPEHVSSLAKDFIARLLRREPMKRLQGKAVTNHQFFKDIDWVKLYNKEVEVPFMPELGDDFDVRFFDEQFTEEPPSLTPSVSIDSDLRSVAGFSYYSRESTAEDRQT